MATTNYSWNLPTVGGSENTWGTQLNSNWTALDTLLGGTNATEFAILDGATVTTAELNKLDGLTATTAELNILDGVTATTAEINKLDGFTGTVADLNYAATLNATGVTAAEFDKLDGLTATTAELNILDGVTATAAEINKLDGVTWTLTNYNALTATAAELNKLDGVTWTLTSYNTLTATAAELNVLDGINGIATQAQAEAGTSSTTLMTPQRTNQAILELGFGTSQQSWTDVTASRSTGTTYTNTTGRAIVVNIETNTASSGSADTTICDATVSGVTFTFAYFRQDDENYVATSRVAGNFIVPAGDTYSVSISGNTVNTWHELR
jgi:hypothetical protein